MFFTTMHVALIGSFLPQNAANTARTSRESLLRCPRPLAGLRCPNCKGKGRGEEEGKEREERRERGEVRGREGLSGLPKMNLHRWLHHLDAKGSFPEAEKHTRILVELFTVCQKNVANALNSAVIILKNRSAVLHVSILYYQVAELSERPSYLQQRRPTSKYAVFKDRECMGLHPVA